MGDGIVYNREKGCFETPWGRIHLNFNTGEIKVVGPEANKWFDADRALNTASMFVRFCDSPGMAIALAIHGQWAAYQGSRSLL